MANLNCISCGNRFEPEQAFRLGQFAWPEMAAFWAVCPDCNTGNHFLVSNQKLAHIKILGAPGPDWSELESVELESLTFRTDPGFLHVWFNGEHYEYAARK